ncbi:MAG: DNA-3-methyladenine glycosylase 2 family protein [Acidimicrobiia bacterium]|nr:DNA-3-methyladenine glycosylase 2 family protein [Acidimicrobiia bacterium]
MTQQKITIPTPLDFGFWRTAHSHGWCALRPFVLDKPCQRLTRVLRSSQGPVLVELASGSDGTLQALVRSPRTLNRPDVAALKEQVAVMLRLDESLDAFYATLDRVAGNDEFAWIRAARAGRLLRSPDLFEDVVKMICTTNCAWSATERMVAHLVSKLGSRFNENHADFPTAAQVAAVSEEFLVREARTGYRSRYLLELATQVARGTLDFSRWPHLGEDELYEEIVSIKGLGPYAAGNLMRLLGHYRRLALDSWCRPQFSKIHRNGRRVSDKTIHRHYRRFGPWSGLVMWLDLTHEWFK